MSKVVEKELRLVKVIQEARDLMKELRNEKIKLASQYAALPKAEKKLNQDILLIIQKVEPMLATMKKELHEAHSTVQHIEKHYMWKEAVTHCFGIDGLNLCYDYMEWKKEELLQISGEKIPLSFKG